MTYDGALPVHKKKIKRQSIYLQYNIQSKIKIIIFFCFKYLPFYKIKTLSIHAFISLGCMYVMESLSINLTDFQKFD